MERSAEMKKGQHSGAQEAASGELYVVVELAGIDVRSEASIVISMPSRP